MSDVRTVSMPRDLWEKLDSELGPDETRSGVIQDLVREYLDREEIET